MRLLASSIDGKCSPWTAAGWSNDVLLSVRLVGMSPKALQAPSTRPASLHLFWVSGTRSNWMLGLPTVFLRTAAVPPSGAHGPQPPSDPRRATCPFKSGPADITAGGGGVLARLPAPRWLQDPALLCACLLLWGPRPGTPPPASSSLLDPRLRPRPGQIPIAHQGTSLRIAPAVFPSQGLSLSLKVSGSQHFSAKGL